MDLETVCKQLFAGGITGCVTKTVIAPLDRTKILLQVHHPYYKQYGVFRCMWEIFKREGFVSLWKGNTMMMLRIFPYAAVQFFSFERFKELYKPVTGNGNTTKIMAGSTAGVIAVLTTYPLDMLRARITFQIKGENNYNSVAHAIKTIYKSEGGVKGFYSGIKATVIGMIPYGGVSFGSFHALKDLLLKVSPKNFARPDKNNSDILVLKTWSSVFCGGLAGAFSQTVSFPLDVVRRRMQLAKVLPESHKYESMVSTLVTVYKDHGISKGLYRGLSTSYIRVVPQQAIAFTVYEFMKETIGLTT